MRKLFTLSSLLLIFILTSSSVSAQRPPRPGSSDSPAVDLQAIAESTLSADLDTMIMDLEVPMDDDQLPERFSSASFVPATEVTDDDLILGMEDTAFAEGSVGFNVSYDPPARGLSFGMASLNYIVVEDEITDEDLDDFQRGVTQGQNDDVSVEDININGVRGVLIGLEVDEDGILSVVQMIAVPVGNTMVLSMVVAASDGPDMDARTVRTDAVALLNAGITHLGAAADEAQ